MLIRIMIILLYLYTGKFMLNKFNMTPLKRQNWKCNAALIILIAERLLKEKEYFSSLRQPEAIFLIAHVFEPRKKK